MMNAEEFCALHQMSSRIQLATIAQVAAGRLSNPGRGSVGGDCLVLYTQETDNLLRGWSTPHAYSLIQPVIEVFIIFLVISAEVVF